MANAKRDGNFVPTMIGLSNADGSTILNVYVNSSHKILVNDATTGTDQGGGRAAHDQNHIHTLTAVSNADGSTPVALYVKSSTNELLVNTQ